ncbi:MAG: phage portal protein [Dyella sp.]|uniref:phage portal protein n=1 Tax=Dyella sp. TaxID=1869338 RepID=UPI003F7D9C94
MNRLDRIISYIAPLAGARRVQQRMRISALSSAYDAVESGRLRRKAKDWGSGNTAAQAAQRPLRDLARHLDRNHDLARGALNVMVRNIVGATGIGVEPQPLNPDGTVNEDLAKQLAELHRQWRKLPEVTGEYDWARSEQLLCRSWLRDGEVFWQYLEGEVPYLTHATPVPFSLELMESDVVPLDQYDLGSNVYQGIRRNAWGRPISYFVYKSHPGDIATGFVPAMKEVSTDRIGHLKLVDRIGQLRGVSMFASVLTRLDDLKDYEESERVAAKVAASMAAYIKKGAPEDYAPPADAAGNPLPRREMTFQAGMVFDDLNVGEDVGTIDSKRPNPNAIPWREGQLKAVAAGADVGYSSISRNYDGSYSAQRQELVETWGAYALLSNAFIDQCSREIYERQVAAAVLGGLVKLPRGMTFAQLTNALYIAPQMPWIDPLKEANAYGQLEDRCYISGAEVIRRMGRNPRDTLRAEEQWQQQLRTAGVVNTTTVKTPAAASAGTAATVPADGADATTQQAA